MPGLRVAVGATWVGERYNPGPVRTRQAWDAQTCSGAELGTRGYRGSPELDETPFSSPVWSLASHRPGARCCGHCASGQAWEAGDQNTPQQSRGTGQCAAGGEGRARLVCRGHPGRARGGTAVRVTSQDARPRPRSWPQALSELPAVCPQTGQKRGPGGARRAFVPPRENGQWTFQFSG